MTELLDLNIMKKLRAARRRTFRLMLLERYGMHFWRGCVWGGLFLGLWLFEIPSHIGHGAGVVAFFVFLGGLFYFHYNDMRFFKWPRCGEIDRRLEQDNGAQHRPLGTISDELSNPERTMSRALWSWNKRRALENLSTLKPAKARRAVYDPYFVRAITLIFFLSGVYVAGVHGPHRIWRGLTPFEFTAKKSSDDIVMTITPPAYTGLSPMVIKTAMHGEIEIPTGSKLKISLHGGFGTPYLQVGNAHFAFTPAGKDYLLETPVPEDARQMRITQTFFPRATWNYKLIPDEAPTIEMVRSPEVLPDGSIKFPMNVADDYGVKTLTMHMEIGAISLPANALGAPISESRSIMSPAKTKLAIAPVYNLAGHPWAGQPVKFTFEAEDGAGHKTTSAPIAISLPERTFSHPLARALINLRKQLIANPLDDHRPIETTLENIMEYPQNFQGDWIIELALRSAASRLHWADRTLKTAQEVFDLLWDTALRLEDGNLSIAERHLRDAQNALEDALKNPNLSNDQIAKLTQNLRAAMNEYLTSLAREMQKRMAKDEPMPMLSKDDMAKMIDEDGLNSMINQMESQMASGDRDAARKLLSRMQNMTDALSHGQGQMPPEMKAMMQGMNDLKDLIKRQEDLLTKTQDQVEKDFGQVLPPDSDLMKKWNLDNMPPPPSVEAHKNPDDLKPIGDEQENLRHTLGDIMTKAGGALDKIPDNMTNAEQEMRGAVKDLNAIKPSDAATHQTKILEDLKQSQKDLSQQLAERMKNMTGLSLGGMKFDPLGRPYGDNGNNLTGESNVQIPDEAQRKQAQEIEHLIQRRSGELDRPDQELDYYRRLLRRF